MPSHHPWKGELLIPVQVTGPQRKFSVSQTRASDLWLSQPGPGVLELFTDQLDPDSGSVIVEVKKNRLELRAELEQRFYSTSGDLK